MNRHSPLSTKRPRPSDGHDWTDVPHRCLLDHPSLPNTDLGGWWPISAPCSVVLLSKNTALSDGLVNTDMQIGIEY